MNRAWTLLLVGDHNGLAGKLGSKFDGSPAHYERVDVTEQRGRPMVIGRYEKSSQGTGTHHLMFPPELPDGKYEIVLRAVMT